MSGDREDADVFGDKVDVYGNYIVVGSVAKDDFAGASYIFSRSGKRVIIVIAIIIIMKPIIHKWNRVE